MTVEEIATLRVMREVRLEMRRQRKWTAELAEVLGVSQRAVQRKFTGETPVLVPELIATAHWLSIDCSVLVERAGE
ncbi:hypothetical protein ACFXG4_04745 [Nocardia sp. NPDC059246]|uniref:hypothetical protein n=1 Tax=unclassified Nocardia TaxID=2637762 RepID=UPI0036B17C6D